MKTKSILAILLITIGIAALVYQGVSWTTTEKAVDLGPIQITAEKSHSIPLSPIVGAAALIGGIILLASGRKTA